jgi:hypothetical protein
MTREPSPFTAALAAEAIVAIVIIMGMAVMLTGTFSGRLP